eukprot:scaffold124484_cov29-Tisochrysis_lutea.AAC.4
MCQQALAGGVRWLSSQGATMTRRPLKRGQKELADHSRKVRRRSSTSCAEEKKWGESKGSLWPGLASISRKKGQTRPVPNSASRLRRVTPAGAAAGNKSIGSDEYDEPATEMAKKGMNKRPKTASTAVGDFTTVRATADKKSASGGSLTRGPRRRRRDAVRVAADCGGASCAGEDAVDENFH